MRPTVPQLLAGVAAALESDVVDRLDDAAARNQVIAAVALLRRVVLLIPHLPAILLADCDDMAAALTLLAPHLHEDDQRGAHDATVELALLDPRRATLDEIDRVHQLLLAAVDAVLARPTGEPAEHPERVHDVLQPLLERMVTRERDVGASIDRPLGSPVRREEAR